MVSLGGVPALVLAAGFVGYLLGSVPFGLLLLKLAGGPDPRTIGSGNIGATNVVRAGGRMLGLATLVLDAAKGAIPGLLFVPASSVAAAVAGLAAVIGHCFPIWLRFKGGKGVATFLGALAATTWPLGPIAFVAAWGLCAAATRYASVASLAATWISVPVALFAPRVASGPQPAGIALLVAAAVVTFRHRANLDRLRRGEEPRIGDRPIPA